MVVASKQGLRDAAEGLGTVYMALEDQGALPLDKWALPSTWFKSGVLSPNLDKNLLMALSAAYPDQSRTAREWSYINAYRIIKEELGRAALEESRIMLNKQIEELREFDLLLGRDRVAKEMHLIAKDVEQAVGGFEPSWPDYEYATRSAGRLRPDNANRDELVRLKYESYFSRLKSALLGELARPKWERTRRERVDAHHQAINLWKVLSLHRQLDSILVSYAKSPTDGYNVAHQVVEEVQAATAKFDATLHQNADHVWKYAPLITLGVKRLRLDTIAGFSEYAVDIGQVISHDWREDALSWAGGLIFLVGVLLTWNPAATGVALDFALTGVAAADLATTGAATQLAYLREREQELAAMSSDLKPTGRLAEHSEYIDSVLGGAATLMCGIALVFSGAQLIRALWKLRVRVPGLRPNPSGPTAARLRTRANVRGIENKELNRLVDLQRRPLNRQRGPLAGPRWSRPGEASVERQRMALASGMRESPPIAPKNTDVKAVHSGPTSSTGTLADEELLGGSTSPGTIPTTAPPGSSEVADTSLTLTPQQRKFPTKVLTKKTEEAVGKKLELATGLKTKGPRSKIAMLFSEQIPPDEEVPPITESALLEKPVITNPDNPAKRLASTEPDLMLVRPGKIELFEVTMDARFSLVPQERGVQLRGQIWKGDPHKQIQIDKTLEYLIRRYPDYPIVYNIQTIGEVPDEVLTILRTELQKALRLQRELKGKGSVEIILRANQVHIIK